MLVGPRTALVLRAASVPNTAWGAWEFNGDGKEGLCIDLWPAPLVDVLKQDIARGSSPAKAVFVNNRYE